MIVYHADTQNKLKPGMTLKLAKDWGYNSAYDLLYKRIFSILAPDGISHFGANHMIEPPTDDYARCQSVEIMAEYIRLRHFSSLQSRLTCAFAARSVEAAKIWSGIVSGGDEEAPVYALECNIAYIADARLLDFPDTQSYTFSDYPASMLPSLYNYWNQMCVLTEEGVYTPRNIPVSDPGFQKEEILVPLPVSVLYRVP